MVCEDKLAPRHPDRIQIGQPLNKYNALEFIELMKVIHCLDLEEYTEMMNHGSGNAACGYADMKRNMLDWLCTLDELKRVDVFMYAEKKRIWYELKRSK